MAKKLVLVESPAKAKTIGRILKNSYEVKATLGHVRDLPEKNLGVDPDNGFKPEYALVRGKNKVVKEIKAAAKDASIVYLATDPDREGEAISWHLLEAAKLQNMKAKRVVFHEITQDAVDKAFRHPRDIDINLVNAQQARRILDRLVGYKISPILWRKVRKGLSAGRVQSVVVRMVVEREREMENFVPTEYWSIEAELNKKAEKNGKFKAELVGTARSKNLNIPTQEAAEDLVAKLKGASYSVSKVQHKTASRQPSPPFITSTLQQEAWRRLGFSSKRTMAIAQGLYEGIPIGGEEPIGLITYMRTDSTYVTTHAITEAREYIKDNYGSDYVPKSPRTFKKKVKGAQEAHEAIRPTSVKREPIALYPFLNKEQLKLYELIWNRMVASQMAATVYNNTSVDIQATTAGTKYMFRATSSRVAFPGFLALYSEGTDDEEGEKEKAPLPELSQGEALELLGLFPEQHFTKPPSRYTEATLVKALEANGIGRPSTYAPILSTIQDRGYVQKEKGRFKPEEMGAVVTDLLKDYFPDIVDIGFTVQMENRLDSISWGEQELVPVLQGFYGPFTSALDKALNDMPKVKPADEPTDEICEKCGSPMVIKHGRFGRFLSCSNYPQCKNAKPIRKEIDVNCPKCGAKLVERRTKKGRIFYGCSSYPNCDFAVWEKPISTPCPKCGGLLVPKNKEMARCTGCGHEASLEEIEEPALPG